MTNVNPPWPDLLNLTSQPAPGNCEDCDERFVNATGDVMTGSLTLAQGSVVVDAGGLYVKDEADFGGDIYQQSGGAAQFGRFLGQNPAEFLDTVTLFQDPELPLEASTKQYCDGNSSRWFDGEGPPSDPHPGADTGDYYLDTLTGDVYVLNGGVAAQTMVPGAEPEPVGATVPQSLIPGG